MVDILGKEFKMTILKMVKELMKDIKKVKKCCMNKMKILIKNRNP